MEEKDYNEGRRKQRKERTAMKAVGGQVF